ncbi:hypothetical protein HWV62_15028 [Athelia sp. TMB]|nr:hypothetical protein HWV62_15028 [Athelia sp. TMB]
MNVKSFRRHMKKHEGIRYPCRFCAKPFSQLPNLEAHERRHEGKTLKCDACAYETFQNSDMTRHKQKKHGHGKGGKKVGHTKTEAGAYKSRQSTRIISSVPDESPALSSSPYLASPEAFPSSSSDSFYNATYPLLALSPSPVLPSPDLFWDQPLPTFLKTSVDDSFLDLDSSSLFHPSGFSFAENRFNEPEGLHALIASFPDAAPLSPLVVPSTPEWTPPLTFSPNSPDPREVFPDFSHFGSGEWAITLEELKAQEVNQFPAPDFWSLVSNDGEEFMNEPLFHVASDSFPLYDQRPLF